MSSVFTAIRFNNKLQTDFSKTLTRRVNDYFKSRNISKHGNGEMVIKSAVMFALYFIPYALVLSGLFTSLWIFFGLQVIMGVGLAGIGLAVMHDANHGAYSKYPWVNKLIGYSLNLVGGNATNWKIQHNVKHHTYTNVDGHDEDVAPKGGILRLSPHSERKPIHKYQHIYAWFIYGLMTISWIAVKDIRQLITYTQNGLLKKQQPVVRAWTWLLTTKLFYYIYILAIPMIFSPFSWWALILGFLVMHYVAGFILAIVFQPAHVIEQNEFPNPDDSNILQENWMVHQLKTTCNFAHKNRLLSWYVGGLNYQVEHHLFPTICHVHYRKLSKIVRETAQEYGFPYKSYDTFRGAIAAHGKMLYALGRS